MGEQSGEGKEGPISLAVEAIKRKVLETEEEVQTAIFNTIVACNRHNLQEQSNFISICVADKTWKLRDAQKALDNSGAIDRLGQFVESQGYHLKEIKAGFRKLRGTRLVNILFTISRSA